MKKTLILLFLAPLFSVDVYAQTEGEIGYRNMGVIWGYVGQGYEPPCRETKRQACEEEPMPPPNFSNPGDYFVYKDNVAGGECHIENDDPDYPTNWQITMSTCVLSSSPVNLGNSGSISNLTCRPVNIATGNKFYEEDDYAGQGSSPLKLTRYYNSKEHSKIWRFSYRQSLYITSGSVLAFREGGSIIRFPIIDGDITSSSQRPERLSGDRPDS